MSNHNKNSQGGLIVGSAIIGIALIVCTVLLGSSLVTVKGMGQTIKVTGAAYKPIVSDYAVWQGNISVSAVTLDASYAKMKTDLVKVKTFLKAQGFDDGDYEVGTVSIKKSYNRDRQVTGYNLRQGIKIELADVGRITDLSKAGSSLIEKGVEFDSRSPQYIFTGLDALKLDMIQAATENAKLRAERLASATGMKVGAPRSARVGVFQIRPRHSQEVSGYGINDQSTINKEIVCTVHIDFLID